MLDDDFFENCIDILSCQLIILDLLLECVYLSLIDKRRFMYGLFYNWMIVPSQWNIFVVFLCFVLRHIILKSIHFNNNLRLIVYVCNL